jgi:hypothetical protein
MSIALPSVTAGVEGMPTCVAADAIAVTGAATADDSS